MAARKRRRRRLYRDFLSEDPIDGLEINNVNSARKVSGSSYSFSIFDSDNICIEYYDNSGKRRFHRVSVLGNVRHANASKTRKINGYKERIKGR